MIFNLLKAYLLGICAAVPVGPVMLFVLQKSLNYGRKAGLTSGLGSACMDTIYAAISLFILALAEEFISCHEVMIDVIGGSVIFGVGLFSLLRNPFKRKGKANARRDKYSASFAVQTFCMALANPAALFVMFGLFSVFGIEVNGFWTILVLCMVFAGELSYWALFSWFFARVCKSVNYNTLAVLGKLTAIAIAIFGVVLIVKGVLGL